MTDHRRHRPPNPFSVVAEAAAAVEEEVEEEVVVEEAENVERRLPPRERLSVRTPHSGCDRR